jgi:prepilin-type N-terminal cleavage/methylation domain-containing protein
MARKNTSRVGRRGFSLIELVIVVVIIGIIAAIAIPRMSRGTAGASDSALGGNLNVLRNAVELYTSEHGGLLPTAAAIENQLTQYTDDQGNAQATKDATHQYGPYLRKIPAIPVGTLKGTAAATHFQTAANDTVVTSSPTGAWLFNTVSGNVKPNLPDSDVDQNGKIYNTY